MSRPRHLCEIDRDCLLCRAPAGVPCPGKRPHRVRVVMGAVGVASEDAVAVVLTALEPGERQREITRQAQIARILAERSPADPPDPAS